MSATAKQLRSVAAAGAAAGVDQGADVGFARGDDAIERHGDILEVGHRLQPIDVTLVGGDFGVGGTQAGFGAVIVGFFALLFLHRDHALGRVAPALVGRFGELLLGLPDPDHRTRRVELGLRGGELRIEIRRFDLAQNVALFHVRAEIEMPVLQVAADTGVNRRFVPGLDSARQNQPLGHGAGPR
jgi:hypothetical protein